MKNIALNVYEALVLQQIEEAGTEDLQSLASELTIEKKKVLRIVTRLKHKGLVLVNKTTNDIWVEISHKGKRIAQGLWPSQGSMQAL